MKKNYYLHQNLFFYPKPSLWPWWSSDQSGSLRAFGGSAYLNPTAFFWGDSLSSSATFFFLYRTVLIWSECCWLSPQKARWAKLEHQEKHFLSSFVWLILRGKKMFLHYHHGRHRVVMSFVVKRDMSEAIRDYLQALPPLCFISRSVWYACNKDIICRYPTDLPVTAYALPTKDDVI